MNNTYDWTPHLQDGEEVLWQGRPDQRALFLVLRDAVQLGFGLLALWAAKVTENRWLWTEDGGLTFAGMAFAGFWIVSVAFGWYADRRDRRREHYAITPNRALRVITAKTPNVQDVALSPDLTVMREGRAYPLVLFATEDLTQHRFRRWRYFDAPPLGPFDTRGADLVFRVPQDADKVVEIAQTAARQRIP